LALLSVLGAWPPRSARPPRSSPAHHQGGLRVYRWPASEMEDAASIPGATAASVLYAEEQGWLELEVAHSACLTAEGRRLIAREAH
jgi:hypothetical protein